MQCPQCGGMRFEVTRQITVWQTLSLSCTDGAGHFDPAGTLEEDGDELGDTVDTGPYRSAACADCGVAVPVGLLFPLDDMEEGDARGLEAGGPHG